jgi:hypothetical protein
VRAVFPVSGITDIQGAQHTGVAPKLNNLTVLLGAQYVVPGAVRRVAFGKLRSPSYQNAARVITATGTLTGSPAPQCSNERVVELFLPSGTRPRGNAIPKQSHSFLTKIGIPAAAPLAVAAPLQNAPASRQTAPW